MGMSSGGNGGGINDINITPLVDVVLVLLIIFIVVAPLLNATIDIKIPEQAEDAPEITDPPPDSAQIVLQLRPDAAAKGVMITINDEIIQKAELSDRLKRLYTGRRDKILFFDALDEVPYGPAVEVMDLVRDEGLILGVVPEKIESGN